MEAEGYIDNGGYREDTEHNHKKSQTWAGGRVQGQVHWSKQGKGTHMAQMDMGQGRTQRSNKGMRQNGLQVELPSLQHPSPAFSCPC